MKRKRSNPLSRTDKAGMRLGYSASHVRRLIRLGRFGRVYKQKNGKWLLQEDHIQAFLEKRRQARKARR